jgi:predicted outer membrane repeat protein
VPLHEKTPIAHILLRTYADKFVEVHVAPMLSSTQNTKLASARDIAGCGRAVDKACATFEYAIQELSSPSRLDELRANPPPLIVITLYRGLHWLSRRGIRISGIPIPVIVRGDVTPPPLTAQPVQLTDLGFPTGPGSDGRFRASMLRPSYNDMTPEQSKWRDKSGNVKVGGKAFNLAPTEAAISVDNCAFVAFVKMTFYGFAVRSTDEAARLRNINIDSKATKKTKTNLLKAAKLPALWRWSDTAARNMTQLRYGGVMYFENTPLEVINCRFYANGVYNRGRDAWGSAAMIASASHALFLDTHFHSQIADRGTVYMNMQATFDSRDDGNSVGEQTKAAATGPAASLLQLLLAAEPGFTFLRSRFYSCIAHSSGGGIELTAVHSPVQQFSSAVAGGDSDGKGNEENRNAGTSHGSMEHLSPTAFHCVVDGCHFEDINSRNAKGAAITTTNGVRLHVHDSVFQYNVATYAGGAIASTDGTLNVTDSTFFKNSAANGGALFVECPLKTMLRSEFRTSFVSPSGKQGESEKAFMIGKQGDADKAFMQNLAPPSMCHDVYVVRCTFEENAASIKAGAVLATFDATVRVIDSNFYSNSAVTGVGGAVAALQNSLLAVTTCLFYGHQARDGGTILLESATLQMHESKIEVSVAKALQEGGDTRSYGGAILLKRGATATLTRSAVYLSTASLGGAVYIGENTVFTVIESLLANNTADWMGGGVYVADNGRFVVAPARYFGVSSSKSANITIRLPNLRGMVSSFSPLLNAVRGESIIRASSSSLGGGAYVRGSARLQVSAGGVALRFERNRAVVVGKLSSFRGCDGYGAGIYFDTQSCTDVVQQIVNFYPDHPTFFRKDRESLIQDAKFQVHLHFSGNRADTAGGGMFFSQSSTGSSSDLRECESMCLRPSTVLTRVSGKGMLLSMPMIEKREGMTKVSLCQFDGNEAPYGRKMSTPVSGFTLQRGIGATEGVIGYGNDGNPERSKKSEKVKVKLSTITYGQSLHYEFVVRDNSLRVRDRSLREDPIRELTKYEELTPEEQVRIIGKQGIDLGESASNNIVRDVERRPGLGNKLFGRHSGVTISAELVVLDIHLERLPFGLQLDGVFMEEAVQGVVSFSSLRIVATDVMPEHPVPPEFEIELRFQSDPLTSTLVYRHRLRGCADGELLLEVPASQVPQTSEPLVVDERLISKTKNPKRAGVDTSPKKKKRLYECRKAYIPTSSQRSLVYTAFILSLVYGAICVLILLVFHRRRVVQVLGPGYLLSYFLGGFVTLGGIYMSARPVAEQTSMTCMLSTRLTHIGWSWFAGILIGRCLLYAGESAQSLTKRGLKIRGGVADTPSASAPSSGGSLIVANGHSNSNGDGNPRFRKATTTSESDNGRVSVAEKSMLSAIDDDEERRVSVSVGGRESRGMSRISDDEEERRVSWSAGGRESRGMSRISDDEEEESIPSHEIGNGQQDGELIDESVHPSVFKAAVTSNGDTSFGDDLDELSPPPPPPPPPSSFAQVASSEVTADLTTITTDVCFADNAQSASLRSSMSNDVSHRVRFQPHLSMWSLTSIRMAFARVFGKPTQSRAPLDLSDGGVTAYRPFNVAILLVVIEFVVFWAYTSDSMLAKPIRLQSEYQRRCIATDPRLYIVLSAMKSAYFLYACKLALALRTRELTIFAPYRELRVLFNALVLSTSATLLYFSFQVAPTADTEKPRFRVAASLLQILTIVIMWSFMLFVVIYNAPTNRACEYAAADDDDDDNGMFLALSSLKNSDDDLAKTTLREMDLDSELMPSFKRRFADIARIRAQIEAKSSLLDEVEHRTNAVFTMMDMYQWKMQSNAEQDMHDEDTLSMNEFAELNESDEDADDMA